MYKLICILLFFTITFSVDVECQTNSKTFELNGEINSKSGTMVLLPIGSEIYYPDQMNVYETRLINKHFSISNPCLYPYAFKIGLKVNSEWVYISETYWVDPGSQEISCNVDSSREIPILNNLTMKELAENYDTFERNSQGENSDTVLLAYSKANPNSFVSLWKLVAKFSNNGYEPIYDSIYAQFSTKIKNTYTGEVLAKRISDAKLIKKGSVFPRLNLSDSKKQEVLSFSDNQNKFTLIDFWYSHCGPCIGQFGTLKKLYSTYNSKGFSIIGISRENANTIDDWQDVIKKHKLPWRQLLDMNGKECLNLGIYVFPTNFLLNNKGEIIERHISMADLSSFLEKNLK